MKISTLPIEEKAAVLDEFIKFLHNLEYGKIYGTTQILDKLENIAIEKHFIECPYCKRKGNK
jgi:hypothetical protein